MTALVCVSDLHADWATLGVSRFDEVAEGLRRAEQEAIKLKDSIFLCLGDIADPDTGGMTFKAIELVIRTACNLARHKIHSIWLAGNHDVNNTGEGATTLTPLKAVRPQLISAVERPEILIIPHKKKGASRFVCLPFTEPSHGYDPAEFCREAEVDENTIVLSHLMLPGIVPGSESLDMPRGRQVAFPCKETAKAKLRLQGHFHKRQKFDPKDGGVPIQIIGSLARLTFAEESNDPAILVIEV